MSFACVMVLPTFKNLGCMNIRTFIYACVYFTYHVCKYVMHVLCIYIYIYSFIYSCIFIYIYIYAVLSCMYVLQCV